MYTEQYNQLNRQRVDWQTEEEVRLGWLTILQNTLAITFHAERGRSDADYNQVIIEFKNVGLFHGNQNSAKFQEALEELSRYIPAKAGIEGLEDTFVGPTAVVYTADAEDITEPARIVSKYEDDIDALSIKGGMLEGKVASQEEIKKLAAIPGREGLLSMLVSVLQAPVRNFAYAVKAVADSKDE